MIGQPSTERYGGTKKGADAAFARPNLVKPQPFLRKRSTRGQTFATLRF